MSGDHIGYWLGRLGGTRLLLAYCHVSLGSGKCVRRAVAFYRLHGKATVVLGRFVMGVRALVLPLAGSARMPFAQFILFDSFGALIWSSLFVTAGYWLGSQMERVEEGYRTGAVVLAGALGVAAGVYLILRLYRRRRHGPASLRPRAITRARDALGLPSETCPRDPIPTPRAREGSSYD